MLTLAVDTSAPQASAAILRDGVVAAEVNFRPPDRRSTDIVSVVEWLLATSRTELEEIGLFAAAVGPGSFTGLRNGLAAVMGMASALAKPIVGVSTAEAVAHPFLNDDIPVAALIESGRTQLFVQLFERTGTGASPITEPMAVTPTEIGRAVRMRALLVGSPVDAYRETFRAVLAENALFPERGLCYHHAGVVATIAERNFRRTGKAETPSPIYVRPADDVYPPPAGEASPVGGPP